MRFLLLLSLATICLLSACSKDDNTSPKVSAVLTGTWQATDDYANNDPDPAKDKATRYILNVIQAQSGTVTGGGETSYSKKPSSQTNQNEWRGPFPFALKAVTYDHPILKFTIEYKSGEEDEVFDGLVTNDKNKIEGNIKYVSFKGAGNKIIFERK